MITKLILGKNNKPGSNRQLVEQCDVLILSSKMCAEVLKWVIAETKQRLHTYSIVTFY